MPAFKATVCSVKDIDVSDRTVGTRAVETCHPVTAMLQLWLQQDLVNARRLVYDPQF